MTTSLAVNAPPQGKGWLWAGRRLRWVRELGAGASSRVWSATDEEGRTYAVKVGLEPGHAELFAREAESLALARCPSLVVVHGGGRLPCAPPWQADGPRGLPYLVLDAVPGVPLAGYRSANFQKDAASLLRDLAEALDELHGAGVAHGDLKPANILVEERDGSVRATLIDLGLQGDIEDSQVEGGTPRYLAPELWASDESSARGAGDGRCRDLYALALSLAEHLVPELRSATHLKEAVEATRLPEPFEGVLRPLLADKPALRPSARWLLNQVDTLLGVSPERLRERRRCRVRRHYLRVRRDELTRVAVSSQAEIAVGGAARTWIEQAAGVFRAARALRGDGLANEVVPLGDLSGYGQRRWLVGVVGPAAAGWFWQGVTDELLAERLLSLADCQPLEAITRSQVHGASGVQANHQVPDDPILLALRLAELPVDMRVLERIEALPVLHPDLGVAAVRVLRQRGEYARARLLASRLEGPRARLEAAVVFRRLGDGEGALRELEALEGQDAEIASLRAAQLGRQALDDGELDQARDCLQGHRPTAPLLETRALLALALGDRAHAHDSLREAQGLAMDGEQAARLEGVAGMLAHAEARPDAALIAFQRAASHAERAGALLEEATYLTGVAAAATDQGKLSVALPAAERSILLFEALGLEQRGARAALARASAYALLGAEAESLLAGQEALARAVDDPRCAAYVHLALCDGLRARREQAIQHVEQAARFFGDASPDDQLRLGARRLSLGLNVAVSALDELAETAVSLDARFEWWGARAEAMSAGRREGRADHVLDNLLLLAAERGAGIVRGPSLVHGARLALTLARSEDARRLLAVARQAARELLAGTPSELRRHLQALDWIALAEAPEGSHFAVEQLGEIEALVRSLGQRERLKPLLEQVLDALLLWTGVERGLLLLKAPASQATDGPASGERLVVRAARNLAREDLQGRQLELSQSLARRALEKGAPVVAVDAAGELSDVHESVHALQLRSVLAVPLIARGETQGVVYLDDRVRRGAFGASELAWVKLVATLAAVAIADARDQLRLRRAARRARRAEVKMAESLAQREAELELAERELSRSRETRGDYSTIVGQSEPVLALLRMVDRVAASEVPVLICGESGTGKELIARAIHDNGRRAQRAFVAENCAAIPEPLLESTLFGHVRGAFTGAERQRPGLFELAHGGTLVLDEIAEMPLSMQTKLLRVLQEGEVRPIGSDRAKKVDVRVIAATHRDLTERVEAGLFREDLYYRLNVIALRVPALRERPGDIPLLMRRFAEIHGEGRKLELDAEALHALVCFAWPGNVRQLENEVRRLLVLTEGVVRLHHLSPDIQAAVQGPAVPDTLHVRTRVDALERELVETALRRTEGNQTRAAQLLGLSRFGLQKMMKRLEVDLTGQSGRAGRRSPSRLEGTR